jgi:16S rRNA processing protein RimM
VSSPGDQPADRARDPVPDRIVVLGKIVGTFGVKGWLKVSSYTEPLDNILDYEVLQIGGPSGWSAIRIEDGRETGKGVIAKFAGIETPEAGRLRIGTELGVWRSELPAPAEGEYYWSDLEGLEALNVDGELLGRIDHFRTTPAGTVVVVKGAKDLWVPFVKERIVKVDIDAGRVVLDWPLDW